MAEMCCCWKVERKKEKKEGKMKAAAISKFEEIVTAPPALKLDRTKPDADYPRLQSIVRLLAVTFYTTCIQFQLI